MQYLLLLCTQSLNPKRYISQPRGRSLQRSLRNLCKDCCERILCKACSKKSSLQGLLQEGFFANVAARRTLCKEDSLQTCYKDCHHFGCKQRINPSIMQVKATLGFYGTRTQTQRERETHTEKDRVVDEHIHARIVGDGEACRGDWNHTRKAAAGHQLALASLSPMSLYSYTAARRGRWLR
jgi:hypothetical protein